jgi:hypothetical protein
MIKIDKNERVCYNCKYLLNYIGVGYGLRCGKKERLGPKNAPMVIPGMRKNCEYFEFDDENVIQQKQK